MPVPNKFSRTYGIYGAMAGGETGIRTLGTLASSLVFETSLFNHSSISPRRGRKRGDLYWLGEDFNHLKSSEDDI